MVRLLQISQLGELKWNNSGQECTGEAMSLNLEQFEQVIIKE